MSFLTGLGVKRDEIITQFQEILVCVRDLLLCKQSDRAPLCFFANREEAVTLSYRFSAPELLRISDAIEKMIDSLDRNANVRMTFTAFAIEIGLLS